MALADRLKAVKPSGLCKFARINLELSTEDRDALKLALRDGVPPRLIANALTEEGHALSEESVRNHRQGKCCCGPR